MGRHFSANLSWTSLQSWRLRVVHSHEVSLKVGDVQARVGGGISLRIIRPRRQTGHSRRETPGSSHSDRDSPSVVLWREWSDRLRPFPRVGGSNRESK